MYCECNIHEKIYILINILAVFVLEVLMGVLDVLALSDGKCHSRQILSLRIRTIVGEVSLHLTL